MRAGTGLYLRSSAAEKLAGLQMQHFGAFYKSAWRANDWMWGRLDGAGWLVHLMLDPRRIRKRFTGHQQFLDALVTAKLLEADDRSEVENEVAEVFADGPLPVSLPGLALKIAAPVQRAIARQELPVVSAQIESDSREGRVEAKNAQFLIAVGNSFEKATDDEVDKALRACTVGTETIRQDAGSARFITTTTTTAATVAATLGSAFNQLPGPAARMLRSLRAVTLTAYIMAKGLRRSGPIGLVTGIAIAIASGTSGAVQTIAVVAASVLLLFLLSVGLSGEKRPVMKIMVVVAAVAAVMFTALAGRWPEPWFNWPLDLVSAGVTWLRPRWLATCIVVLLLVGWILYPFLRLGRQKRISRVARRVSSSSDG
jgi:hypothetical protein